MAKTNDTTNCYLLEYSALSCVRVHSLSAFFPLCFMSLQIIRSNTFNVPKKKRKKINETEIEIKHCLTNGITKNNIALNLVAEK